MENEIETVRNNIRKYFEESGRIGNERVELSESGLYYFSSTRYRQNDVGRNWTVCKIEIWDVEKCDLIGAYITDSDDSDYAACWLSKANNEYLILPEAFQGQSVFDVKHKKLHSFYSHKDPFIWMNIYPSPDGNKIAVDGCYWACPNELRVYNSSDITSLPYKIIYQDIDFTSQHGCVFEYWEDNNTVRVCKNHKDILKIKI